MNENLKFSDLSENVKAIVNLIQNKDGEKLSEVECEDLLQENSREELSIAFSFTENYDYPQLLL